MQKQIITEFRQYNKPTH